jgi:hypothetical protein
MHQLLLLIVITTLIAIAQGGCAISTTPACFDGIYLLLFFFFRFVSFFAPLDCSESCECMLNADHSRVLGYDDNVNNYDDLSLEYCAQLCFNNNYTLAGTEAGNQCYCGNSIKPGSRSSLQLFHVDIDLFSRIVARECSVVSHRIIRRP